MSNHKQLVRLQNGQIIQIARQNKELVKRESELCIKCPLIEEYIPIISNCINECIRQDGRRRRYDIRLYGEPSNHWHEYGGNVHILEAYYLMNFLVI
jgi:hypothetical protein